MFNSPPVVSPASASPCVGLCSVTVGDQVCRGCFRTLDAIAQWSTLCPAELHQHLSIRQRVLETSFHRYFSLVDEALLFAQWQKHVNCPPHPRFPVEAWIQLLHLGAHKMQNVNAYGMVVVAEHAQTPLRQLWRQWRAELLDPMLYQR